MITSPNNTDIPSIASGIVAKANFETKIPIKIRIEIFSINDIGSICGRIIFYFSFYSIFHAVLVCIPVESSYCENPVSIACSRANSGIYAVVLRSHAIGSAAIIWIASSRGRWIAILFVVARCRKQAANSNERQSYCNHCFVHIHTFLP